MRSRHHDAIMAKMPELCCDDDCRDTNWGGRGRAHTVHSTCPMYQRELRKLQMGDQWAFTDAVRALPKNDLNAKIKYNEHVEEVTMSLDAFLAIAKNFQGHVEYGIKQAHGGEGGEDTNVYALYGMSFKDARDLAEMAGKQLMQKFDSGWIEA